jgi:hypothetical protein
VSLESYCRDIENYLCRKNEGHLIRIAGPAFERVSKWAEDGIPLKVACAGIDRYFERYYRRGPRRRPVRIEFCEPDVLDAFDDWRRAVGVLDVQRGEQNEAQHEQATASRARQSLATHIARVLARLTTLRASSQLTRPFEPALEDIARQLDRLQAEAKGARGSTRDALLAKLAALDRELISAAVSALDDAARTRVIEDAKGELAPFRTRMSSEVYNQALTAACERQVRAHFGLPSLVFA